MTGRDRRSPGPCPGRHGRFARPRRSPAAPAPGRCRRMCRRFAGGFHRTRRFPRSCRSRPAHSRSRHAARQKTPLPATRSDHNEDRFRRGRPGRPAPHARIRRTSGRKCRKSRHRQSRHNHHLPHHQYL